MKRVHAFAFRAPLPGVYLRYRLFQRESPTQVIASPSDSTQCSVMLNFRVSWEIRHLLRSLIKWKGESVLHSRIREIRSSHFKHNRAKATYCWQVTREENYYFKENIIILTDEGFNLIFILTAFSRIKYINFARWVTYDTYYSIFTGLNQDFGIKFNVVGMGFLG